MTRPTLVAPTMIAACLAALATPPAFAAPAATDSSAVAELQRQAERARPLVRSKLARRFLAATESLPHVETRIVFHDSARTRFYWEPETAALPESARTRLVRRECDEHFYYNTRYGSPLACMRALELLADAGLRDVEHTRLVDFGYGTIGHLRLIASLGAKATGIEVDPLLDKLYGVPGDQGNVKGVGATEGRVRLVHGSFPSDSAVRARVGGGYDLFISKNTLKRGYIHPEQAVSPRMLVHLGVSDTAFVEHVHRVLKPGGFAMIYNLSPAPSPPGKPYKPWADGRCPFPRELWEASGFTVIAYDLDDGPAARAMGRALGWADGPTPMDLENDLFAHYTLVRKR